MRIFKLINDNFVFRINLKRSMESLMFLVEKEIIPLKAGPITVVMLREDRYLKKGSLVL